jgi:hypothetical protein
MVEIFKNSTKMRHICQISKAIQFSHLHSQFKFSAKKESPTLLISFYLFNFHEFFAKENNFFLTFFLFSENNKFHQINLMRNKANFHINFCRKPLGNPLSKLIKKFIITTLFYLKCSKLNHSIY